MNTHSIDINPVSLTSAGYRYEVRDRETGQVWIEKSKSPICDAARLLHSLGAADEDMIETYRTGSPARHVFGSVGYFRKRTAREDEKKGPAFVAYRPRPSIAYEPEIPETR